MLADVVALIVRLSSLLLPLAGEAGTNDRLAGLQSRYLLVNDALAILDTMNVGFFGSIIEIWDGERFHPQYSTYLPEDRNPKLPLHRGFDFHKLGVRDNDVIVVLNSPSRGIRIGASNIFKQSFERIAEIYLAQLKLTCSTIGFDGSELTKRWSLTRPTLSRG